MQMATQARIEGSTLQDVALVSLFRSLNVLTPKIRNMRVSNRIMTWSHDASFSLRSDNQDRDQTRLNLDTEIQVVEVLE